MYVVINLFGDWVENKLYKGKLGGPWGAQNSSVLGQNGDSGYILKKNLTDVPIG